jgi:hypothetical protein
MILACVAMGACAAFKRPVRTNTLETRTIAPEEQARIKAMAAEAEAAAAEMQARLARRNLK